MSLKVLIVDSHNDFRRLLIHHISIGWPDAIISEYDPSRSGPLPEKFAGAGNDLVMLGSGVEPTDAMQTLRGFCRTVAFPPIIYFAGSENSDDCGRAREFGAGAVLVKNRFSHDDLKAAIKSLLVSRRDIASTAKLFYTDTPGSLSARGYRLIEKISSGNFSAVYLTEHELTNEIAVLKVLRHVPDAPEDSEALLSRFIREYELIASLKHPNIVRITDFGVADDHAFIAMEHFPEGDLRKRIKRGMSTTEALTALKQIADALAAVHGVGILHRDLKPGNIMCRADATLALIDFGLAKQLKIAAEITGTGEIFGTPYYMSPEQGHGRALDERGDIYSLGVIFYEMLTGVKPFLAETAMGIIYMHSHAARPRLPVHLAEYQPVLDRMIAAEPKDRFQSVTELLELLP